MSGQKTRENLEGRPGWPMILLFLAVYFALPHLRLPSGLVSAAEKAGAFFAVAYLLLGAFAQRRPALFAASRSFAAFAGAFALGVSFFPLLPYYFGAPLLLNGPRAEKAPAAVVLGGGIFPDGTPSSSTAWRVMRAARLYHAGKAPLLLLSAGNLSSSGISEARVMARLARSLGVPREALLLEEGSQNTFENARESARQLRARGIGRVFLVTDPLHMRRSRERFSAHGIEAIPAETMEADKWLEIVGGWDYFQMSLHEYLGLLYYRATAPPAS